MLCAWSFARLVCSVGAPPLAALGAGAMRTCPSVCTVATSHASHTLTLRWLAVRPDVLLHTLALCRSGALGAGRVLCPSDHMYVPLTLCTLCVWLRAGPRTCSWLGGCGARRR